VYVVRRLVQAIPVVLGITIVTFFLLRLIPGDPAMTLLGNHGTPEQIALLRARWGLDEPIWIQFWLFLKQLAHGDTGASLFYQVPTRTLIASRISVTMALVAFATLFSVLIAVPLATIAATRKDRSADHVIRAVPLVGLGMPSFWVGLVLILVFAVNLGWFPVGGWGDTITEHIYRLILPGLTSALAIVPLLVRSLRVGMLEVLQADYVATARSKGLREHRVLLIHVARNAIIPTLTLLGINIAFLIGATVVVERVFQLNGLGSLMLASISNRDFPVVQGVTFVFALSVVIINLVTDLTAARLDPRIRLS
jgi:ABC-type dipeptide/oligopeptide/nickel transport systems, permease components